MQHEYTLRRRWIDRQAFDAVLEYIRSRGELRWFGTAQYMELHVAGWAYFYWNVPPERASPGWDQLINRKPASLAGYRPRNSGPPKAVQLKLDL